MHNIAIQRAFELPADVREAVEKTLGRALKENEEVSIMALSPHPAPSGETRRVLARRLEERLQELDFSLHRDFPIHESVRLRFQADMFNVFNHPSFGPEGGTLNSPTFGATTVMANSSLGTNNGSGPALTRFSILAVRGTSSSL